MNANEYPHHSDRGRHVSVSVNDHGRDHGRGRGHDYDYDHGRQEKLGLEEQKVRDYGHVRHGHESESGNGHPGRVDQRCSEVTADPLT